MVARTLASLRTGGLDYMSVLGLPDDVKFCSFVMEFEFGCKYADMPEELAEELRSDPKKALEWMVQEGEDFEICLLTENLQGAEDAKEALRVDGRNSLASHLDLVSDASWKLINTISVKSSQLPDGSELLIEDARRIRDAHNLPVDDAAMRRVQKWLEQARDTR